MIVILTAILAGAAIKTWLEIRKTGQRQLRAYLGFSFRWISGADTGPPTHGDYNMLLGRGSDGHDQVGIFMSNHGQTPAHDVRFLGACILLPDKDAESRVGELLKREWDEDGDGAKRLVDPRAGEALPSYYLLRDSHGHVEPMGGQHIYAYGRVEYKDIFNTTHETTICAIHDPVFGAVTGGQWRVAAFHNRAS
jgi:hypothetical protein